MQVEGIFCDLAKASDCANHEILLAKLPFYGIWGEYKDSFRSPFSDQRHKVEIKSLHTAWSFSLIGVKWNMEFPKDQFQSPCCS